MAVVQGDHARRHIGDPQSFTDANVAHNVIAIGIVALITICILFGIKAPISITFIITLLSPENTCLGTNIESLSGLEAEILTLIGFYLAAILKIKGSHPVA